MFKFMKCYNVLILTIQNLTHEHEYIYAYTGMQRCVSIGVSMFMIMSYNSRLLSRGTPSHVF